MNDFREKSIYRVGMGIEDAVASGVPVEYRENTFDLLVALASAMALHRVWGSDIVY